MLDSYEKTETRLEIMEILNYYRAHKGNSTIELTRETLTIELTREILNYYRAHKGNSTIELTRETLTIELTREILNYYRAHKGNLYYPLESRESRESLS